MTAEIINLAEYRRKREVERAAIIAAANTIVGGGVAYFAREIEMTK